MTDRPTRSRCVLVVEDNPDNRTLATKVLRRAGFDTREADRAEGLEAILAELRPDLILMDMELPGMSGYAAVQQLKSGPATSDIPIIALTAYAMQEDRQRCLRVGCSDYLSKPLDIGLLVEAVRKHLKPEASSERAF